MDKPNFSKSEAMQQINDLYGIISGNLRIMISGPHMISVGTGVALIPFIELFLRNSIDKLIINAIPNSLLIIFILRAFFYWSSFGALSLIFKDKECNEQNLVIKKITAIGKFFPIIPVATAAALSMTGNSNIISPIVLILIGTIFTWFGQFTSRIVSIVAWANISAGIIGIFLSVQGIKHLWAYLVFYQGCTFIAMGAALWYLQSTKKISGSNGD